MATFKLRDSGWWQAVIRRKGHPVQSKTFEKKTDAEKWARDVESRMNLGIFVTLREAEQTTLSDALLRYQKEVTSQKRGAAQEEYRINTWRNHPLACKSLAALRGADFAGFRNARLKVGCAASTVQKELALVSHLFTVARQEWGMEGLQNPLESVKKPTASNGRDRGFLDGEEERLLAALDPKPTQGKNGRFTNTARSKYLLPVVQLALETAMRQGELAELLWENVDLKKRIAFLPLTKNGESRTVPLSSTAVAILEGLKPKTSKTAALRGSVFKSTTNAIKLGFIRAVKRARETYENDCKTEKTSADPAMLLDLHFHDLRHIATSRLAAKLPNLIELAAVTGHKDLRMLKRYYHPKAEDLALKLG